VHDSGTDDFQTPLPFGHPTTARFVQRHLGGHARNVNIVKGKVRFVEPMLAVVAVKKLLPARAP
jgi:hypothetical protein